MESPLPLKQKRSWFSKGVREGTIEVISCNNIELSKRSSPEIINPIDQSSPKLAANVDTSWIDTKNVHDEIEQLTRYHEVEVTGRVKKRRSFMNFSKNASPYEEQDNGSEEEQINEIIEPPELCLDERPKSRGSLGRSVTPLKIRDNINYFFNFGSNSPESKASIELEKSGVFDNFKPLIRELQISRFKNLNGLPCSRLALLDHNQCSAFLFQLNSIKRNSTDYSFYYDWVMWLEKSMIEEQKGKQMYMDRVIETKSDLKVALKVCKKLMQNSPNKIHIAKVGISPRRKTQRLIKSGTLEFRVPMDYEYDMFKEISNIVLDNMLYKPQDIQCMYQHLEIF